MEIIAVLTSLHCLHESRSYSQEYDILDCRGKLRNDHVQRGFRHRVSHVGAKLTSDNILRRAHSGGDGNHLLRRTLLYKWHERINRMRCPDGVCFELFLGEWYSITTIPRCTHEMHQIILKSIFIWAVVQCCGLEMNCPTLNA